MERLLHMIDYPQLYSLSIVFSEPKTLLNYLTGDTILIRLLAKQITHFYLTTEFNPIVLFESDKLPLFALILSLGKCLTGFTFVPCIRDASEDLVFNRPSTICVSSTLTNLNINVSSLDDCLYILDGRFHCLSSLIIDIEIIRPNLSIIDTTKEIPKLKYLSITSISRISYYHELVPLFHRIPNLEQLILFLFVKRIKSTYRWNPFE
ncbi:hypothetical protein I4U23_025812 [Adineta vaga]|nr:hypothetical protein I4U23_025812 [Adineta vaga]